MFARTKQKKRVKLTLLIFVFLIVIPFQPFIRMLNSNPNEFFDANATFAALHRAKSREIDLDNKYQFTAIILHWKRLLGVQKLIKHYLKSNLFKEIIVWNNNPQINLTHSQILPSNNSSTHIYIINSKENLKDQAKYRACVAAQTLVCFYADDDWDVSHYMKTLISSFLSDPNVLHSATNKATFYNNMLWTFMDRRIDLHTGFSWIGSGSVFLREHAQRHLQLLTMHLQYQELFAFSDTFFSIWLNNMPSQMVVNLRSLSLNENKANGAFSFTKNFPTFQHTSSVWAIHKLEYSLRVHESTTSVTFPRQQNRRFPYCVKSPSRNDDFIFYANILPIDIESIPFDIKRDIDRATYRNAPRGSNYTHFLSHSTLKAVDSDEKTCWRPLGMVKKGDFFAVDFLRIKIDIKFALIIGHSQKLQRSLDIRISFDGVRWISYKSANGTFVNVDGLSTTNLHRLVVDSRQFPHELRSFRYIAFNATYAFAEAFQICDIKIIKNVKMNAT